MIISPDAPLAFVDVETTGCAPGRDRIIDIAVIGARGGEVEFQWQSLVNPGVHIGAGISALTGIDNDMLVDAPAFEAIARELRECQLDERAIGSRRRISGHVAFLLFLAQMPPRERDEHVFERALMDDDLRSTEGSNEPFRRVLRDDPAMVATRSQRVSASSM